VIPAPRETVVRRFPLVPRSRPACHRLDVRVRQLTCLAETAATAPAGTARAAAEACNFGALIASDCGLPTLARDLCWQQFEIWHRTRPFSAATAKLALQPLVNLGRLRARDGDGIAAHHLIETLFTAVRNQAAADLDGLGIDLGALTRSPADHTELIQWLWTVLVTDGTRALAQAGLWGQALRHVQDIRGISRSLLDGRQIAIIAHHVAGDRSAAACLLTETIAPTRWEHAVMACLAVLTGNGDATTMADSYLTISGDATEVVFRTRLGLAVLDLASERHMAPVARAIQADVQRSQDAYAAREVVAHPDWASLMPASAICALDRLVDASGLGAGTIPAGLFDQLTTATTAAEATLANALTATANSPGP
jgi:hypothetical protein